MVSPPAAAIDALGATEMPPTERESHVGHVPGVGTLLEGGYRLVRFLGAGGMGAVFEAVHTNGARVAIKLVLAAARSHPGVVERFTREASITRSLQSPHIVSTYDAGVDPRLQVPFMVMPLMVGEDLEALVARLGPLHPSLAARIVRQACTALETAHRSGVVHRDVKPANLFLDHDVQGRVTVRMLDFGIAKLCHDETGLTATGVTMGTPSFMSPEQFVDVKRVGPPSDVWSLGMTLYHALSGTLPYADTTTLAELMSAVRDRDCEPLQEAAPWIDPGLAEVVHGALIRDVHARCPSAGELAEALQPFAYGSDELTAEMMQPLSEEIRAFRAPAAAKPTVWIRAAPKSGIPAMTLGEHDRLLGTVLQGRYHLLRALGQGGMGTVYEAAAADGSRLAVKVIRGDVVGTSNVARQRFEREANVVRELQSPYVVRVFEVGTDGTQSLPFIAMEMLRGQDLEQVLGQHGALRPSVVARIMVQACQGLAAAHEVGVVHRDVKPANLFLDRQPSGEVVVKVCDFGIAKKLDPNATETSKLTRTGGVVGSPMYMSPEQATSKKDIDARSDVWSLGATMYEALSGHAPWEGASVGELILAICTSTPLPIQDVAPWVPPELALVVERAMARDPQHRFASMRELAQALAPFTRDRSSVAAADLKPIPDEVKAQRAPRAATSAVTGATSHAGFATGPGAAARPRRALLPWVAAVTVLAAGGAGAALYLTRTANVAPDEPVVSPETSAAPVATATSFEVRIPVAPASASVQVDGAPATLRDGELLLAGGAGSRFEVVLRDEDRELREVVVIDASGNPSRTRLELPAANPSAGPSAGPSASASASPAPGPATPKPGLKYRPSW